MKSVPFTVIIKNISFSVITGWLILSLTYTPKDTYSFSTDEMDSLPSTSQHVKTYAYHKYPDLVDWKRPDKPITVGLQVGHLNVEDHPEETEHLRNNTGAQVGDIKEVDVNYTIAMETAKILQLKGITVEILPATVPKAYWADLFLAIHADGDIDTSKSGFKASTSWHDYSGKSQILVNIIKNNYGETTGLLWDPNISKNMLGYYAFNWWKNDYAVHPMTPAVIVETGFLTNPNDRQLLTQNPVLIASALSTSIIRFLENSNVN